MRKLLFVAVMLPALASGAVYKCVDSEGKITFSDRACAGTVGGVKVEVKLSSGAGEPVVSREAMNPEQRRTKDRYDRAIEKLREPQNKRPRQASARDNAPCREFSSTELRTMIIRNQVVVGMRISDALRSWGTPESINGTQYAYFWERGHAFFYDRNGCVSNVQGSYVGGKFVR